MNNQEYTDVKFFPPGIYFALSCGLSAVASVIVSIACLLTGLHKELLGLMIFAINFADAIFFTVKLFASALQPQGAFACDLALSIGYFGLISSVFWSALFGHALYIVSRSQNYQALPKYSKIYQVFAFGLPLLLALFQLPTNFVIFSSESNACVHRFYQNAVDYVYLAFIYIPIGGSMVLSIIWYLLAALKFKRMVNTDNSTEIFTLLIYPAILLICWGPIFIKNLLVIFNIQMSAELTFCIQIVSLLQGFFDALVYGVSKRRFKQFCKHVRCLAKKQRKISHYTQDDPSHIKRKYIKMDRASVRL